MKFREVAGSGEQLPAPDVASPPALPAPAASVSTAVVLSDSGSCATPCGSNGVCFKDQCYCAAGFSGADCSLPVEIHATGSGKSTQLTAHLSSTTTLSAVDETTNPSASAPASSVTFALVGIICFAFGIVACLLAQWAYERYQKQKRQRATQAILTPLLNTLDQ